MSYSAFSHLVVLLSRDPDSDDPTAQNPALFRKPGRGRLCKAVDVQLAAFLRSTSGATHVAAARDTASGEGSSYNYNKRIIFALSRLQSRFLRQPVTEEEKDKVAEGFEIEGCMGAIDGTILHLKWRPGKGAIDYYTRKKCYGVSFVEERARRIKLTFLGAQLTLQTIADSYGTFTSFEAGHPGTTTDVTVLDQSYAWAHRREYLEPGEYWLADKGEF